MFALELKNQFTNQNVDNAKRQWMYNKAPRELCFQFNKRILAYFCVDHTDVNKKLKIILKSGIADVQLSPFKTERTRKMGKDLKGRELATGIRQKADGRYEARATLNGININMSGRNYKRLLSEFEEAKRKALQNMDIGNCNITLDEWFDEWFEEYKKPHIKVTSVYPMISKFKNTFGEKIGTMKVCEIRNIDVQSVVNELIAEGKAASSVRDALGRRRDCMESAKNNRIISINPCFDISVPNGTKTVNRRFLSHEEQEKFLKHVEETSDWYKEKCTISCFLLECVWAR